MTVELRSPGLVIDGTAITAEVEATLGGGKLRYDEQSIEAAEDPTSEVEWEWDGWERRTLEISVRMVPSIRGGATADPYQGVALLHAMARGGGPEPLTHVIQGDLARALGFDVPWVVEELTVTDATTDHQAIEAVLHLIELDPEAVTAIGTAPQQPDTGSPETDATPAPATSAADDEVLTGYDSEITGQTFGGE